MGGCDVAAVTTVIRLYKSNKVSAQGASRNAMALQIHDSKRKRWQCNSRDRRENIVGVVSLDVMKGVPAALSSKAQCSQGYGSGFGIIQNGSSCDLNSYST